MAKCWKRDDTKRPTFSELVDEISSCLTTTANYIDFNMFRLNTETTNGAD